MSDVDKAFETQLRNIQIRTGKTLDELYTILRQSGLTKHGELRDMLKRDLGMGHGDANTFVHYFLQAEQGSGPQGAPVAPPDVLDQIYAGPKAHLRPIHEALMKVIGEFGAFEVAPKKGYVSLRRKRQFAMIGPPTQSRIEVGLNMKGVEATERLIELPAGGMTQYKVNLTDVGEVDSELVAWIGRAYDAAG
jgi:hypothetical protein